MISVLVTGSNGQLGRSIQDLAPSLPEIRFVFKTSSELDITDYRQVKEVFADQGFDYCINCAAFTDVERAEREPPLAFRVNAEAVKGLSEACLLSHTVLIHVSTDYVFDGTKRTPYLVTDKTNPINVYGASKLKGEEYIKGLLTRYFIVRTSWLYSEYGKNFYKTILAKAQKGEDLSVTDAQTGCPTHARHLAQFITKIISTDSRTYGIHHFTDGEVHTWYSFAVKILKENHLVGKVEIKKVKNYSTFAKRPEYSVLKNTTLQPE